MAPEANGRILIVCPLLSPFSNLVNANPYLFRDCNRLYRRQWVKFIAWWLDSTVEDVEHARNSLKAEHVISEVLQYFVAGINSRADLFAGISIFSCAGSGLPSIIGRSVFDVWLYQLPFGTRKVLRDLYVFVKLDSCSSSVFASQNQSDGRIPKSKHSSSNC